METPIDRFVDDYFFLSNFGPSPILWRDARFEDEAKLYMTVEHAYQAAKVSHECLQDLIRGAPSPGEAKRRGRTIALRPDWERVKVGIMLELLRLKFAPGSSLAQQLLETGDRPLIEGNSWGDAVWGQVRKNGRWEGENLLGKLLMQVRDELRAAENP